MEKILVAVDDTRGSKYVLSVFSNLVRPPEEVILLHVERLEGRSLMIDMLGEAELSTLKEQMKGTEHKERLDKKAEKILSYCKRRLEERGTTRVKTVIRDGLPAEEILRVAREEDVELIILGHSARKGLNRFISGSVARDVEKKTKVPVLVAKKPVIWEETSLWRDAYYAVSLATVLVLFMFVLGILLEKVFLPYK
ncbi:MAG: universal stress protein [Nitrospirae bacterium]|nr:universal stress protein [Nitrospirota bacterium]